MILLFYTLALITTLAIAELIDRATNITEKILKRIGE
jgi:hypothetical protein